MNKKRSPSEIDKYVGKRLRNRRMELNLSQEGLGYQVDLTFQQIQKYERGVNRIACSKLYELGKVLHVNTDYFFEGFEELENTFKNVKPSNALEIKDSINILLKKLKSSGLLVECEK